MYLAILFLSLLAGTFALPKFPNIEYLGSGYDVFLGNPTSSQAFDPGFRNPILAFSYKNNSTSSDFRFLIPDQTNVENERSCTYTASQTQYSGETSYQKYLYSNIAFGGSAGAIQEAFTGNGDFVEFETTLVENSYNIIWFASSAQCYEYDASVAVDSLSPYFLHSVAALPVGSLSNATVIDSYMEFIGLYGTHFIQKVSFGARYDLQSSFEYSSVLSNQSAGFNFGAAATASWGVFAGDAKFNNSQDIQESKEFDSWRTNIVEIYIGGNGTFVPENPSLWEKGVIEDPLPMAYTLWGIWDILSQSVDPNSQSKAKILQELVSGGLYCQRLNQTGVSCRNARPDPPPPGCPINQENSLVCSGEGTCTCQNQLCSCECTPGYGGVDCSDLAVPCSFDTKLDLNDGNNQPFPCTFYGGSFEIEFIYSDFQPITHTAYSLNCDSQICYGGYCGEADGSFGNINWQFNTVVSGFQECELVIECLSDYGETCQGTINASFTPL